MISLLLDCARNKWLPNPVLRRPLTTWGLKGEERLRKNYEVLRYKERGFIEILRKLIFYLNLKKNTFSYNLTILRSFLGIENTRGVCLGRRSNFKYHNISPRGRGVLKSLEIRSRDNGLIFLIHFKTSGPNQKIIFIHVVFIENSVQICWNLLIAQTLKLHVHLMSL